jgi:ABC-type glycerol-3-phosphate transport system permease component
MSEQPNTYNEMKQLIADYVEARVDLIKLEVFEKIAKVTAALFSSVVVALLGFFLLFFLSMSAGFYLSRLFDSQGIGFIIVTGFYLLLFGIVLFRKKDFMEKYIIDRIIGELTRKEGEDGEAKQ